MGDTGSVVDQRRLADAVAGDVTRGTTKAFHRRSSSWPLRHEGAVRAVRHQSKDGIQMAGAVRGGGTTRAGEPQSRATSLPAQDWRRGRQRDLRSETPTPGLGPPEASRLARATAPRARTPGCEHGRRSPGPARSREEASSAAPSLAPWRGATHDGSSERPVDGRLQGPLQNQERHLLLSAHGGRSAHAVPSRLPRAVVDEGSRCATDLRVAVPRQATRKLTPKRH